MGFMLEQAVRALAVSALVATTSVQGFTCETTSQSGKDNYGPGVSEKAVAASTSFEVGAYNAIIAFDASHCIEMCCAQEECALAVFNEAEAVCYLKSEDALQAHNERDAPETIITYTIERRIGDPMDVEMTPTKCSDKRGVAYGFSDSADMLTLNSGMSWWYDWSPGVLPDGILEASLAQGSEYIPMIWSEQDLTEERLRDLAWVSDSAPYLLGFNEPNYQGQANLEAAVAAEKWSQVKQLGKDNEMMLVSPAVNFCYGDCVEEDPHRWLDDFFEACDTIPGGCGITHLAIHSYSCEVKYLNKHIHSYTKYELPIWLTEFACGFEADATTEAKQAQYLSDAIAYLELNPHIFRYAWFTARSTDSDGIDNSDLLTESGELTKVGQVFVTEYTELQHCGDGETLITTTESVSSSDSESLSVPTPAPKDDSGNSTPAPEPENPEVEFGPTGGPDESDLDVDPQAAVIVNAVITNVGGAGYYDDVVDMMDGENMKCPSFEDACMKQEVCVSGDLVPFNEVSVSFRGPMNLHNIVWYEGTSDKPLDMSSSWTAGSEGENLVFMNNRGGVSGCSGVWSICGGNGQSFADATGTWCAAEPTAFKGEVPDDNEVNIMTAWECASEEQCGFFRDVGMRGWTGGADGTKVMVFEVDMPHCEEGVACTYNRPAVWALNSKVHRTAQYGCNCRGMGGNGGCGEFDILEAIIGNEYSDMLFTTVYDFKGAASPGTAKYFQRPSEKTVYAAIFRGGDDSYLQVAQLENWDFGAKTMTTAELDALKDSTVEAHAIYDVDSRSAPNGCSSDSSGTPPDSVVDVSGLAEGYEYVGCFGDFAPFGSRDMALRTKRAFPKNKPSMCASRCAKEAGSTFFGLQGGEQCWCGGMGESGPGSYGEAENCNKPCPGNEDVVCGGKKASSVYVIPVDHTYVGCFADKRGDRDMFMVPKAVSDYLTPAACAVYCSSVKGAKYFGVQSGRKCFCGDAYGKHGESNECAVPCSGDKDQVCGAVNINSVYTLLSPEEIEPAEMEAEDMEIPCDSNGYCGCFADTADKPLLSEGGLDFFDRYDMTRDMCKSNCASRYFEYYGLKWGVLCLCGDDLGAALEVLPNEQVAVDAGDLACKMVCPEDEITSCTGQNVDVWKV